MNYQGHLEEAERLLDLARRFPEATDRAETIAEAQAHATLAVAEATRRAADAARKSAR